MPGDSISDFAITVTTIISHFGICLILFFIGLILFSKKNKTVEGYFSAVASNSIFDLLFSIVVVVIKVNCFYKNGFFVFVIGRFDYELDPFLTRIILVAHIFTGHMYLYVVFIPFYIRYSLICRGKNVSHIMRTLLYLFMIAYDIINSSIAYIAFQPSPTELAELQMKPYLRGNEEGRYWNFVGAKVVS